MGLRRCFRERENKPKAKRSKVRPPGLGKLKKPSKRYTAKIIVKNEKLLNQTDPVERDSKFAPNSFSKPLILSI